MARFNQSQRTEQRRRQSRVRALVDTSERDFLRISVSRGHHNALQVEISFRQHLGQGGVQHQRFRFTLPAMSQALRVEFASGRIVNIVLEI